jgi:hypothetical protein
MILNVIYGSSIFGMSDTIQHYIFGLWGGVSIYVDLRYLRPHFYSYPLMPLMMGTGVLQGITQRIREEILLGRWRHTVCGGSGGGCCWGGWWRRGDITGQGLPPLPASNCGQRVGCDNQRAPVAGGGDWTKQVCLGSITGLSLHCID